MSTTATSTIPSITIPTVSITTDQMEPHFDNMNAATETSRSSSKTHSSPRLTKYVLDQSSDLRTIDTVPSTESYSETSTSISASASALAIAHLKSIHMNTSTTVDATSLSPLPSPIKRHESSPLMKTHVNLMTLAIDMDSPRRSDDDMKSVNLSPTNDENEDNDNDTEGTELNSSFNSTHSSIISDGSLRHLISSTGKALSIEEHDLKKEITRPFIHSQPNKIEDADDHLWNEIRHLRNSEDSLQHEIDFAVDKIAYGHETTKEIQGIVCETSFHSSTGCRSMDEDEMLKAMERTIAEGASQMESLGKLVYGKMKQIVCCEDVQEAAISTKNVNGDYMADSKQFETYS